MASAEYRSVIEKTVNEKMVNDDDSGTGVAPVKAREQSSRAGWSGHETIGANLRAFRLLVSLWLPESLPLSRTTRGEESCRWLHLRRASPWQGEAVAHSSALQRGSLFSAPGARLLILVAIRSHASVSHITRRACERRLASHQLLIRLAYGATPWADIHQRF